MTIEIRGNLDRKIVLRHSCKWEESTSFENQRWLRIGANTEITTPTPQGLSNWCVYAKHWICCFNVCVCVFTLIFLIVRTRLQVNISFMNTTLTVSKVDYISLESFIIMTRYKLKQITVLLNNSINNSLWDQRHD